MRLAAFALFSVVVGGFDTPAEAHSLSKTIFGSADSSVVFTQETTPGTFLVICDRALSTSHSQYDCFIYANDGKTKQPLISSEGWCTDTPANTVATRMKPGSYSFLEPAEVDCRYLSYENCKAADPWGSEIEFTVTDAALYSCNQWVHPRVGTLLLEGPAAPILRLTVDLFDAKDHPNVKSLTDGDILPPVVKLSRYDDDTGQPVDVTYMLSRSAHNQFRYDVTTGHWNAALDTSLVKTSGRYFASAVAGDSSYLFEPGCVWLFTRE